jgi:hypothetical protein
VTGCDISEWQLPGSVNFNQYAFVIIRTSHGVTEDKHWRAHFNNAVNAGKPIGFYHYLEQNPAPENQANFFRGLTDFLSAAQVHFGWWCDAEEGWITAPLVDRFRSAVHLPTCGLYSSLSLFNGPLKPYMHFALNWVPLYPGWFLQPGWEMPDHILTQTGSNPIDTNEIEPAQPYPAAWQ